MLCYLFPVTTSQGKVKFTVLSSYGTWIGAWVEIDQESTDIIELQRNMTHLKCISYWESCISSVAAITSGLDI